MGYQTADDKFYLFAFVNFVPGQYGAWQAAYDDLAVYVHGQETSTQTYYFGIPFDYASDIDNTTLMFAFEVYDNRAGLYETHFTSPAMLAFIPKAMPAMTTGFDLQHYALVGGAIDLPGDSRPCGIIHDTKIVCSSTAARDTVLARLAALAREVTTASAPARDGGILSWMAFACLDNETDARILARYRDGAALDATNRLPAVLDFWKAGKEADIARMEQRGYVENGKGWLHR